jgi:hypothetical protein
MLIAMVTFSKLNVKDLGEKFIPWVVMAIAFQGGRALVSPHK